MSPVDAPVIAPVPRRALPRPAPGFRPHGQARAQHRHVRFQRRPRFPVNQPRGLYPKIGERSLDDHFFSSNFVELYYFNCKPRCVVVSQNIRILVFLKDEILCSFSTKWEGRMGKYLARGHDLRTVRSEVRTP